MACIFPGIISLVQYVNLLKHEPETLKLAQCPYCSKSNPWRHGGYLR